MRKTYMKAFYPGVFVSDTHYQPVESREISEIEWPERAYAVQFFDRTEVEEGGETLKGPYNNPSPLYYKDAQLMSYEDVQNWPERGAALLDNMRINKWYFIVRSKYGQCFPVEKDEKIVLV